MADEIMADKRDIAEDDLYLEQRPLHRAYLENKLPCPHRLCKMDRGIVFYQKNGLAPHFRVKHGRSSFDEVKDKTVRDAHRLLRYLHGEETKQHLMRISEKRLLQKVDEFHRFAVTTSYEGCSQLELISRDPKECAKLAGMLLLYYGQLRSYSEGSKPEVVEIAKPGLCVKFNLWYTKRNVEGSLITIIVPEAIFVKRDQAICAFQQNTTSSTREETHFALTGNRALDTLRQVFKLHDFRGKQQETIESIMKGQNTLLVMPTGGGKTICYAVPAVMESKVAVVVFPLLALLLDQAARMTSKGLKACYLMADMEESERETIMHKLNSNSPEYNFFFVTPETVQTPDVIATLESLSSKDLLSLIVIDEAHCIDMWGFHFRPSYLELWKLCEFGCPVLAMTGTATPRTESVIRDSLRLSDNTVVIRQQANRPNLVFHVAEKKSNGIDGITSLIKQKFPNQCGIIYCVERKDTVNVTYCLKTAGINAVFYHAGMDIHEKQANVDSWMSGCVDVICATVAFGMGIDNPGVKFVIHHSMPKNLESYMQESGRAGRDGSEAHCYIFFRFEERTKHLRNICSLPDSDRQKVALNGLNSIVKYCIAPVCRKQQIAEYFDHEATILTDICSKSCDICMMNQLSTPVDGSKDANELVCCLEEMQKIQPKVTTKLLALTYRGSKSCVITKHGFQNVSYYGRGKNKFNDRDLNNLIQYLIIEQILEEQLPQANENRSTPYVCEGGNAKKSKENNFLLKYYKLSNHSKR